MLTCYVLMVYNTDTKQIINNFSFRILLGVSFIVFGSVLYQGAVINAASLPQEYVLKVGETIKITEYFSTKITLKNLQGISTLSYPSQGTNVATILVHIAGGCSGNSPGLTPVPINNTALNPPCLGMPEFQNEYTVSGGQTIVVLGLKITAISITTDTLKIQVIFPVGADSPPIGISPSIPTCIPRPPCSDATPHCLISEPINGWCSSGGGFPTPAPESTCLPRPACLDSTPRCLISEPASGWCSRVLPTPIPVGGISTIGSGEAIKGTITICPIGNSNCTVCSGGQCSPTVINGNMISETTPGVAGGKPLQTEPVKLMLPPSEQVNEVDRIEANTTSSVYQVKTTKQAKLLFLFPVTIDISYVVHTDTGQTVIARPWWNFLAW